MKKVPAPTWAFDSIEHYRVYFDDLQELLTQLSGMGLRVSIQSEGYVFDDIEELKEKKGGRARELELQAYAENEREVMSATFSARSARLQILHVENRGAEIAEIRDRFRSYELRKTLWNNWLFWAVLSFCLGAVSYVLAFRKPWASNYLLAAQLLALAVALSTFLSMERLVGVYLRPRHEGNFFRRNLDQLILVLIGAVVGGVLTFIGGVLLKK